MKTFALIAATSLLAALIASTLPVNPAPPADALLAHYPAWAVNLLCASNAYAKQNPQPGKTLRFQTPVAIQLNDVPHAREAAQNLEALTSDAVTFKFVDTEPSIGMIVVAGDALTREGTPGLGHVTSARAPQSAFAIVGRDGVIQSRVYVHLGSPSRDFAPEGFRATSIPEHELAHALGLFEHFPGFTGIEGISLEMLVALTALYRVPPGTDVARFCNPQDLPGF